MYWTVYHCCNLKEVDIQIIPLEEEAFWINLPGAPPMRVRNRVIQENGLDQFIIRDRGVLRRIQLHFRVNDTPWFSCWCFDNSADLMHELDVYGTSLDQIAIE